MNDEEIVRTLRTNGIETLRLLADREAQRAYERDVPIADVPAELLCLVEDLCDTKNRYNQAAFTPREHEQLARLDRLVDKVIEESDETLRYNVEKLQSMDSWGAVVAFASGILAEFESGPPPDPPTA